MEKFADLYFIRAGKYVLVKRNITEDEAWHTMIDHIKPYNLADGYIRLWPEDGGVMYDFGSWTDFYFWGKRGEQDNE